MVTSSLKLSHQFTPSPEGPRLARRAEPTHRPITTSLPLSRSLHSTPLLPIVSALFCSTALTQPFLFQLLPHSFHRHGGVYPFTQSVLREGPLSTFRSCARQAHELRSFAHQLLCLPRLRTSWGEGVSASLKISRCSDQLPSTGDFDPVARNSCFCAFNLRWSASYCWLFFLAGSNSSPGCQPATSGSAAARWPSANPNCAILASPVKSHSAWYSSLGWW
jgi:hypothetical protein